MITPTAVDNDHMYVIIDDSVDDQSFMTVAADCYVADHAHDGSC